MAKEYFVKEGDVDVLRDNVDKKISSPNTAEVGQILSVKAIDGNGKPTEWEVVNKPGSGPGESSPYIYMTQEEYEALTEYEQDRMYWVTYPFGGQLIWKNGEAIKGDGFFGCFADKKYLDEKYSAVSNYLILMPKNFVLYENPWTNSNNVTMLAATVVENIDIASTITELAPYVFRNGYRQTALHGIVGAIKKVNINNSVKTIRSNAFYHCDFIKDIEIPNGTEIIESSAFYNCYGLESVTIGNGVTSIGGNAFYECRVLKTVVIGNGIETIASSTFTNCSKLELIVIDKPKGSVSGAPWGATNATVVWTG